MEGTETARTATVIGDLVDALAVPGTVNAGFAAYLTAQLTAILEEEDAPRRGSSFNGRLVALAGELPAGSPAHLALL